MRLKPHKQDVAQISSVVLNFIQELKQQTRGKVDLQDIDKLILSGLGCY